MGYTLCGLLLSGLLGGDGVKVVRCALENGVYEVHDGLHILFLKATGGDCRGAYAEAAGCKGAAGVEGHHVLVHGNIGPYKFLFRHAAGEVGEFSP